MSGNDSDSPPAKNDLVQDSDEEDPGNTLKSVKKGEKKSLLAQNTGFQTLYRTSTVKDNHLKSTKFKQFSFEKRQYTRHNCPMSHFDGYNLWMLKPTHMNRGRGIHVFNDLPTLHKLIKEYCFGKEEEGLKKK